MKELLISLGTLVVGSAGFALGHWVGLRRGIERGVFIGAEETLQFMSMMKNLKASSEDISLGSFPDDKSNSGGKPEGNC